MFLRYFAPLYEPIRWIRNKWVKASTTYGRVRVDVHRVKSYKNLAKSEARRGKEKAKEVKAKAKAAKAKALASRQKWAGGQEAPAAAYAAGGYAAGPAPAGGFGAVPTARAPVSAPAGPMGPAGGGGMPGPAGNPAGSSPAGGSQPGSPPPLNGGGGVIVSGALWWKKHLCASCGQVLDRTWDRCPYCSVQAVVAGPARTQAIMMDHAGIASGMQLLGWLVCISRGPQRGELFTLAPHTTIGTDPGCTIVLHDGYMSGRHCEIRAEGGHWVLRDLKSTNGTCVNDKRVEQHELVDSDFIKVGQSVLKFKSL